MSRAKGKNVRLTTQAHILCSENAEICKTSMKAVASEAIFLMFNKEKAHIEEAKEQTEKELRIARANVIRLEGKIRNNKLFAFGAFLLGAIVAGCLGVVIGVIL